MEPQYSVLIFSKYSPNCKRLFDIVGNSGIDFDRAIGSKLQLLCIDNTQIRQRIKNNEKIEVVSVPCILSIFPNGGVEKYDGGYAFSWIENLINKYTPITPSKNYEPEQPEQPELQLQQKPELQQKPQKPELQQKPQKPELQLQQKPKYKNKSYTSITDLPPLEEEEEDEPEIKPVVTSEPNDIRSKAEALARGRDDIDRQFSSPNQRPITDHRP